MKALREIDPIAADEWYYPLNGDMTPDNVAGKSAKWAYFQCPKNPKHIFHRQIFTTLDEKGNHKECPFCKGKEAFPGETDFLTVCPKAKEMWDYSKNTIDPTRLLPNAKCFAYFKCKYGHSFQIEVYKFKRRPFCRECRKERNSLLSANPSVARIWDYEKNGDDRPEYHWKTDSDLVWWKCKKCGYSWQAKISTKRVNKSLCPVCEQGKRLKKNVNDLLSKFPDVILDWDFLKNDFGPDDVTLCSRKKVWWKCHICNYGWKSTINVHIHVKNNIISFRKCPVCMGRIALAGKNDLATTHPSLAKEYVPELNDVPLSKIRAGSPRNIVWRCQKCHQLITSSPNNRTKKDSRGGCPYCSGRKAIPGKTSFKALYPELMVEYSSANEYNPDELVPSFTLPMKWNCSKCSTGWEASIRDRVNGEAECPYCSGLKAIPGKTSFKALYPELMIEWKYISNLLLVNPDYVLPSSTKEVWWECQHCNKSYTITIKDKVNMSRRNKKSCPFCKGYRKAKRRYI